MWAALIVSLFNLDIKLATGKQRPAARKMRFSTIDDKGRGLLYDPDGKPSGQAL